MVQYIFHFDNAVTYVSSVKHYYRNVTLLDLVPMAPFRLSRTVLRALLTIHRILEPPVTTVLRSGN